MDMTAASEQGVPGAGAGPGRGGLGAGGSGPMGAGVLDGRPQLAGLMLVGAQRREVFAQVSYASDLVFVPRGLVSLPGASANSGMGGARLDTLLRLALLPPPMPPSAVSAAAAAGVPTLPLGTYVPPAALLPAAPGGGADGGGGGASSSSTQHMVVEVGCLELSLVDGRPEEVAVLTLDGLFVELTRGRSAGGRGKGECRAVGG